MKIVCHTCPNCGAPRSRFALECEYCNTLFSVVPDDKVCKIYFKGFENVDLNSLDLKRYIKAELKHTSTVYAGGHGGRGGVANKPLILNIDER